MLLRYSTGSLKAGYSVDQYSRSDNHCRRFNLCIPIWFYPGSAPFWTI